MIFLFFFFLFVTTNSSVPILLEKQIILKKVFGKIAKIELKVMEEQHHKKHHAPQSGAKAKKKEISQKKKRGLSMAKHNPKVGKEVKSRQKPN